MMHIDNVTHIENVMQSAEEIPSFESSALFHLVVTSSLSYLCLKYRPSCFEFVKCINCDF